MIKKVQRVRSKKMKREKVKTPVNMKKKKMRHEKINKSKTILISISKI